MQMPIRYFKSDYYEPTSPEGSTQKHIYAKYNTINNTWTFKDDNGSTLINMCFENTSSNKLDCMFGIYTGQRRIDSNENEYNGYNNYI